MPEIKKTHKFKKTPEQKRAKVNERLTKLASDEDKQEIARLKELLSKSDQDLDAMDLDKDIDDVDYPDENNNDGDGEKGSTSSDDTNKASAEQADNPPQSKTSANTAPSQTSGGTNNESAGQADNPLKANTTAKTAPSQTSGGTNNASAGQADNSPKANTTANTAPSGTIEGTRGDNSNNSRPKIKIKLDEGTNKDSLFVPEEGADPSRAIDLDKDPEEPLFSTLGSKNSADITTVGWNEKGKFINRYGKKGCMRYRIDDFCSPEFIPEASNNFQTNALGTQTKEGSTKLRYGKANFLNRIWGVAWEGNLGLQAIDPARAGKKNGPNAWPVTYILTEWTIGKRWETRSTLRKLWGKKADSCIYEAACQAEEYYLNSTRNASVRGYTRSPSAPLRYASPAQSLSPTQERYPTQERQSARLGRSRSSSPTSPLHASNRNVLSPAETGNFVKAWNTFAEADPDFLSRSQDEKGQMIATYMQQALYM
jgi:hypothetical protein